MSELEVQPPRPLDAKLLALADSNSPEEISLRLGGVLRPKAVAARITELLKSRNWLTAIQQDQIITMKMQRILSTLESRFEDIDNMKLQLSILKELGNRLDKRSAATSFDLNVLYENQGKIMARAFALALDHMKQEFGDLIASEVWDDTAREGLMLAEAELSEHEAIEA